MAELSHRAEAPLWWAAAVAISGGIVATLLSVKYLPTNDGPENILSAFLQNHYLDPGTIYAQELAPTAQFASKGFSLVFRPLESLLGWQLATQLTLCIIVLGTFWGYAAVLGTLAPERRWLAIAATPLLFGWPLYMGFFSFSLGQAIGLGTIAFVLRTQHAGVAPKVLAGVLLLVQSVCHAFSGVLTGAVVATILVTRSHKPFLWPLVTASAVCSPVVAIVLLARLDQDTSAAVAFQRTMTWLPWRTMLSELPRLLVPGPLWRALVVWLTVALAVGIALMRAKGRRLLGLEKPIALCAMAFLIAGLVLPFHLPGWQFFSPRFLAMGALFTLALLPVERLQHLPRKAVPCVVTALGIGSLIVSHGLHRRLEASSHDIFAALKAPVQPKDLQLPIVLDPSHGSTDEVPHLALAVHAGALFAVAHGGLIPYMFLGTSASHAFKARNTVTGPTAPPVEIYGSVVSSPQFHADLPFRQRTVAQLLMYGSQYDSIIVLGAREEDMRQVLAHGYISEYQGRSVMIASFQGCRMEVAAWTADVRSGVELEVGLPETDQPFLRSRGVRWFQSAPGTQISPLGNLPCGSLWLRLQRWSETEGRLIQLCPRNGPDDRMHVVLSEETPTRVQCMGRHHY